MVANQLVPWNCALGLGVYGGEDAKDGCALAFQSALVSGDGSLKFNYRSTQVSKDATRVALTAVRIRASVLKWHLGLDRALQVHRSVPHSVYTPWLYRQDDKDIAMNVTPSVLISNGASGMYLFSSQKNLRLYRCYRSFVSTT